MPLLKSLIPIIRISTACNFMQPVRGKKYHSALEPKLVPPGTTFDINDPLLYKTVEPISKWRHSSKNWDPVVSKMMGIMLYDGERETAREIMRKTFAEIKLIQMNKRKRLAVADADSIEVSPIKIINQAVANCTPILVLHRVRRGGFIYKVPAPARDVDAMHVAIRWIIESARNKDKDQRIWISLAHELINAAHNEGASINRKKELSKQRLVSDFNYLQVQLSRIISYSGYFRPVRSAQFRRFKHQTSIGLEESVHKIRNVGLIAHIDAGKTTTTERMLFLAGRTRAVGEVDRGDTVTDYLVEERERGISIVSAAAYLSWRQHDIHLIDTPGHVDFTFEVERGLAAVDSALVIIDACKGVETQTRTVWSQADRYQLPRMIFINKMDRAMASLDYSMHSLRKRFGGTFFPLQMPVYAGKDKFIGIVDLPSLMLKIWPANATHDGSRFFQVDLFKVLASGGNSKSLNNSADINLAVTLSLALKAREQLLASLAELDESFANEYLLAENPEKSLTCNVVLDCVKRVTTSSKGFPVIMGSSRRNIGVQPVLDGIVDCLPDPSQRPPPLLIAGTLARIRNSSASRGDQIPPTLLTFKILFDPQRGPLSLCRIFAGHITPGMQIKNWTRSDLDDTLITEKIGGLVQLTGDAYENIERAGPGYIIALSGLQSTRTGDILGPVVTESVNEGEEDVMEGDLESALVPHPVVHAALEPRSSLTFRNLEKALICMQREDPSFKATFDPETGQWVVAGMGDLHLEVVLSRLRREYKLEVSMGPLLTSHKEMPQAGSKFVATSVNTGLVGGRQKTIFVELEAFSDGHMSTSNKTRACWIFISFEKGWNLENLRGCSTEGPQSSASQHKVMACVRQGCEVAMATGGPLMHSRVLGVGVRVCRIGQLSSTTSTSDDGLTRLQVPTSSHNYASFAALLRSTVIKAVKDALDGLKEWKIIEPVMAVEIQLPLDADVGAEEVSLAPFMGELSRRRGEIEGVEVVERKGDRGSGDCYLRAFAPLAELSGFSAAVRSLSSGRADIALRLAHFRPVSVERQAELLRKAPVRSTRNHKTPV